MQEQRFKELEERHSLMLEDLEIKTKEFEEIETQRSKLRDIRVELSDIFKTLNKDADHEVVNH